MSRPAPPAPASAWAAAWAQVAGVFRDHGAEAYARLARAFAGDPPALAPEHSGRAAPLIVLHAVRHAALEGRARDPWTAGPDTVRHDLEQLRPEVDAALQRGLVQYTDPQRMTDLLPGLLIAQARYPGRALRLIDLGACAGLLLVPERYRIRYPRWQWSTERSTVVLTSDIDVPPPPASGIDREAPDLAIVDRIGVDLAPVDPATGYDYLRSFTWPGNPEREPRLRAALQALAADPVPVVAGEAVELLPELLDTAPGLATVIVDSAVSRYLPGPAALRLGRLLDAAARRGPLMLISRTSIGRVAGCGADAPLGSRMVLVDLSARWRFAYAATDGLSERGHWTEQTAAPRPVAALG